MVLNAAMQMLKEGEELKLKILKFKSGTSMLQERNLWVTQQQLQKVYQKVLVLDLDYALEKKVEQDLWNVGFKQQIEALQSISKDRKNPLRSEGQAMLSWVLQAAAGFYLCLLHQICTTFKLDLPFRRRASLLGWVESWGAAGEAGGAGPAEEGGRLPAAGAARYICQHCLVHLGDLARYRQQLRVAHTFYRHALVVSVHSGQPYNQLALVAWRRGRRLAALYWHVRSLLVRAPFPPAPANLARTLQAAAGGVLSQPLPALPGALSPSPGAPAGRKPRVCRLDALAYVTELIRAMHMIHTVEQLETAADIVDSLNMALTALVATDSFEAMTLVKMACVLIWLVHSSTEDFKLDSSSLSEGEAKAAALSEALAANMVLALLLPTYSRQEPPERALPALKVWLQWVVCQPKAMSSSVWSSRAALWPALAATISRLPTTPTLTTGVCVLWEDEELQGFTPLEAELKPLRSLRRDADYSRLPDGNVADESAPWEMSWQSDPELQRRVRSTRLRALTTRLAGLFPQYLTCNEVDGETQFTGSMGGEQLEAALAELAATPAPSAGSDPEACDDTGEADVDSEDEPPPPPPPVIISEADFREKVREKRVGILKPQGSLERAREERALATTQEDILTTVDFNDVDCGEESAKGEDKKDTRKPRVNIAMAAIMRKQEETSKQVKFVTPPPTPDSTADANDKDQEKPKVIQPKPMKGLVNLPLGRKTGGILSLKDKSGYPHLVNTEPDPPKKDVEEKKETKPPQNSSQNSQNFQPKRQEHPPNWTPNAPQTFTENPRMNFQKNYGIQNVGITYNPSYPSPNANNQPGILLPVVNPKEIDVRTAAMQKQTSRSEMFQDGNKFGNHGYQMSGDKKNFLNDLPPRFANQYRYWQNAQDNQFNDNKFRDDSFKQQNSVFNTAQPSNWTNAPSQENYQQSMPWWKPENPPPPYNANYTQPINLQPNYFSPHLGANLPNPYQNIPYNQMQTPGQQSKPEPMLNAPNYLQTPIGQPQLQTLQNMVSSPNFNSSLNNIGTYVPTVGYDSAMYPQFNNNKLGYQPMQMKMMDKPQGALGFQPNKDMMDVGRMTFGPNVMDIQQRNLNMNYNDSLGGDIGAMKKLDATAGEAASGMSSNTYSLFSGAPETAPWAAHRPATHTQQSLWSVPGPSPLERLLEQQKQMKQPPPPQ